MAIAIINLLLGTIERAAALHQGWENQNKYESTQTEKASETIAKHCDITEMLTPDRIANCLVNEISAYIEKKNSAQDLQAQKDMAYWAQVMAWIGVAGFLISVVGLLALFVSLRQTRIAISDTRQIGEAQVRAYLSVDTNEGAIELESFGANRVPVAKYIIRNSGNSPARAFKYASALFWEALDFPQHSVDLAPYAIGPEPNDILTASDFMMAGTSPGPAWTSEMFDAVVAKPPFRAVVLLGVISYKDVFGKDHKTKFGFRLKVLTYQPPDGHGGVRHMTVAWTKSAHHNDAD